ncbi:MAG: SRPBCC domain-containing protein [Myxococcales bacterium]|nr:SRPBCC domain-containing protein [Myxococcales bacterium]
MSEKQESAFRMSVTVKTEIAANADAVWARLTDAAGYTSWNSTLESLEGSIVLGGSVSMKVPEAPGRTFKVKVVAFEPGRLMVWRDGFFPMFEGSRIFTLTPRGARTTFEMSETFRGLMLPLIKKSLPDFGPIFDRYAADLKKVCESG